MAARFTLEKKNKMPQLTQINVENLGQVQETLMIPLLGRANETNRKRGILHDAKAVEIVERLDYRFDELNKKAKLSLRGAAFRTLIYDHLLCRLLTQQPQATVVELGCGLNTRFERTDNGQIRWFDLDMPDVYQLWQQFFTETERRTFLPYSAFDDSWVEIVKQQGRPPYIFISEASVIYFPADDNRKLFQLMADNFSPCHYIFDTATDGFIKNQDKHDTLRLYSARIQWELNNIHDIESWSDSYKIEQHINMSLDPPKELRHLRPWLMKILMPMIDLFKKDVTRSYFINQAHLDRSLE